jgi:hypothetical protein
MQPTGSGDAVSLKPGREPADILKKGLDAAAEDGLNVVGPTTKEIQVASPLFTRLAVLMVSIGVCAVSVAADADADADVTVKELAPGEKVAIEPEQLEKAAVFRINIGQVSLTIRVSPDGFIQLLDPGFRTVVVVTNSLENRASLDLKRGEAVSIWPVKRLVIKGGSGEFALEVESAGWAFVVRADQTRPGGVKVLCDSMSCTLNTGERLDTDRIGDEVTFRRISQAWPGLLVKDITRSATETAVGTLPKDRRSDNSRPTMPGVLSDRGTQFSWQTIALPTITLVVFRPADVSP